MTLTLVQLWTWPQLQEETYLPIILPGRSSPVSTYPLRIHWWRSSFQKWFWRKLKRRIRNILIEVRAYFDNQGSLNILTYLQALVISVVKSMKSSKVFTDIVTLILLEKIDINMFICFGLSAIFLFQRKTMTRGFLNYSCQIWLHSILRPTENHLCMDWALTKNVLAACVNFSNNFKVSSSVCFLSEKYSQNQNLIPSSITLSYVLISK